MILLFLFADNNNVLLFMITEDGACDRSDRPRLEVFERKIAIPTQTHSEKDLCLYTLYLLTIAHS